MCTALWTEVSGQPVQVWTPEGEIRRWEVKSYADSEFPWLHSYITTLLICSILDFPHSFGVCENKWHHVHRPHWAKESPSTGKNMFSSKVCEVTENLSVFQWCCTLSVFADHDYKRRWCAVHEPSQIWHDWGHGYADPSEWSICVVQPEEALQQLDDLCKGHYFVSLEIRISNAVIFEHVIFIFSLQLGYVIKLRVSLIFFSRKKESSLQWFWLNTAKSG